MKEKVSLVTSVVGWGLDMPVTKDTDWSNFF